MKILYFYQELPTPMFQWHRIHFIDELSHYNIEFDTFNPLVFSSVEEANEKLIKKAKDGKYDLFFSNTCYYKMLFVETLEEMKKLGIPTLTISWDNISVPYMDKKLAPYFDLVWLTASDNIMKYKKWGINVCFAPYAANPYTFVYNKQELNRHVCFIGNPHGSRSHMINKLTQNGVQVDCYYGKDKNRRNDDAPSIDTYYNIIIPSAKSVIYRRLFSPEGRKILWGSIVNKYKGETSIEINDFLHKEYSVSHNDMISIYSKSTLSLASTSVGHTDILNKPLQWVFLRNFEIPMCGGIEICKYSQEIASYFEDKKEIVLYNDDEELLDLAKYYTCKASDNEIFEMKKAARLRSEKEHTWFCRFKQAFDILGIKY